MGKEFELKYKADADVLEKIREKFGDFAEISMATSYFDTPGMALSQRRWMLRRRLENGVSVCTMKTPPVNGERGEWEVPCRVIAEAVPLLCAQGAPAELASLTGEGLCETCGARFTRLTKLLMLETCTVELSLDQGCFLGGGQSVPFAELEVELKAGSKEAAAAFAQALAAEYGLLPEEKSKAQRAMELSRPLSKKSGEIEK